MSSPASTWKVTRLSSALGARVEGVDLNTATSAAEKATLTDLLAEHLVLVFPQQELDAADHVEIGTIFGDPYVHPFLEPIPEHEAILKVAKEPDDEAVFGGEHWHADITYENPPSSVSLLYSIDVPAEPCGDTIFANQFAAYEQLSVGLGQTLETLTAIHIYPEMEETEATSARHEVIRTHPISGRKAIFVNAAFVDRFEGWTREESLPLLRQLEAHQTRPEFQCRVTWKNDQLTIWDNRAVLHYAMNDYEGKRRVLQRVTVMER